MVLHILGEARLLLLFSAVMVLRSCPGLMDQGQFVSGYFVAWLLSLNKRLFCKTTKILQNRMLSDKQVVVVCSSKESELRCTSHLARG